MKAMIKNTLLSIIGISIVLLALAACGSEPAASKPTVEASSSGSAQATVEASPGGSAQATVEAPSSGSAQATVEAPSSGSEQATEGAPSSGSAQATEGASSGGSEQATVEASPGGTPKATLKIKSGRKPNASVSGSVTYRERLALSPGAKLVVELRDVSYQDAAGPAYRSPDINGPGQVPITFKVEYNRDDIDSRNIYGISARSIESDGRLAFINDTAYDVITRGKPSKVDMLLVLVQPPPDQVEEGTDWRQWVETPAKVSWANLIPNEREHLLRIDTTSPR